MNISVPLVALLNELLEGPPPTGAFVLNRGDRGLIGSLATLSAEAASARPGGRSSVAAHVDHLRYGLELLNRWARGEDPWATANFAASWKRQQVTTEEWQALQAALAEQARTWKAALEARHDWNDLSATEALGSVVHLAYHLGAIRQVAEAASGPRAAD